MKQKNWRLLRKVLQRAKENQAIDLTLKVPLPLWEKELG